MHSFNNLLSRLSSLNEAKDSPMDRLIPGFQEKARELAKHRGASSGTREGRLAMLGILFDLDIIDESIVRMFKNDPSVSRMVSYFEDNGIAKKIKDRRDEIQSFIKDQLENKVSFTTGNRTDAAQQRYEVNKLNAELKAAKKVARLERKKETAGAMSSMSQTVDMYDDLIGSMEASYSSEYMLEIVADKDSDLNDITQIVKYLSKFVDESDIEIEGRSIDVVFGVSSKLGKVITKMGIENVERSISQDLKSFGGGGVVIHEPDFDKKEDMVGNLRSTSVEDEEYGEEMEEQPSNGDDFEGLIEDYSDTNLKPEILDVQKKVLAALTDEETVTEAFDMEKLKRTGRGLAAAAGLTGVVASGSHLTPKIYHAGKEIAGEVMSSGGTKDFLAKINNEEDKKRVISGLKELKAMGTEAKLRPSSMMDDLERKRREFGQLEDEMRSKYKIPNNIYLQEAVELTTAGYLTEQVKSDGVKRVTTSKNLSFKEKYKPKTSWQLEELRRYGL